MGNRIPWLLVALAVYGLALAQVWAADNWAVCLRASDTSWLSAGTMLQIGALPDGSDGYVTGEDGHIGTTYTSHAKVGIVHTDWLNPSTGQPFDPPLFRRDKRARVAQSAKTWDDIRVWAGSSYTLSELRLAWWVPSDSPLADLDYSLVLVHDPTGKYADNTVVWEKLSPASDDFHGGYSNNPLGYLSWTGAQVSALKKSDSAAVTGGVKLKLVVQPNGAPVACSIGQARTTYAGQNVLLTNAVVTSTSSDGAALWVESEDRSSGLAIAAAWPTSRGDRMSVSGTVSWVDGVPRLSNATLQAQTQGQIVKSLCCAIARLANDRRESLNYTGMNPVGLLVTITGKVKALDAAARVFYVDDGSALTDGMGPSGYPYVGLRVSYAPGVIPPNVGQYVKATGLRTVEKVALQSSAMVNGELRRAGETLYLPLLALRDQADLAVIH